MGTQRGELGRRGAAALAAEAAGGHWLLGPLATGARTTELGAGAGPGLEVSRPGHRVHARPHTPTRRGFPRWPRLGSSCGGRRRSWGGVSTRGWAGPPPPGRAHGDQEG